MPTELEKSGPNRSATPVRRDSHRRPHDVAHRRRQSQPPSGRSQRYRPNDRYDPRDPQPKRRGRSTSRSIPGTSVGLYPRSPIRKKRSRLQRFFHPFSLEKSFTLLGLGIGFAQSILFAIDLIFAWPLMRASVAFDVTFMLSGLTMIALSLDVARDQVRGHGGPPRRIRPKLI